VPETVVVDSSSAAGIRPEPTISFGCQPDAYRHWRLAIDGGIATVTLAVDPDGGLRPDYQLKLNSYDLTVDIELHDLAQRLRFEHPEVRAVVVTGGLDKVFCAGANIQMLAGASHHHKVNFCKFTNETRNALEDSTATSRQPWICAVNGTAAGGGYELALACDEIVLIDDRASTVSLPEVPLLGVLPGTGGLTRVVDKRGVRRDLADVFATRTEGVGGALARAWRLVDVVAPRSTFAETVRARAEARAATSDRPGGRGVILAPLERSGDDDGLKYRYVEVRIDRSLGAATILVRGPEGGLPADADALIEAGAAAWPLAACRELDEVILHLRFNEPTVGTWVLRTCGDPDAVLAVDDLLAAHADHWLAREIRAFWKRTIKRLDVSARTLVALIEPGSCFAGTLAELALAADRSFMLDGTWEEGVDADLPAATLTLGVANDGAYPMGNGLSRLEARFWGDGDGLTLARAAIGKTLLAADAMDAGLVTFAPDDIDWPDEIRVMLEERNAFNPDALSGLEANLRFVGPETIETKIFARLSAWQNWIFFRPNASGPDGALRRYGTGSRPAFDRKRV
jgi:benzoyl-CoA-dihydrodiol lyase